MYKIYIEFLRFTIKIKMQIRSIIFIDFML